MSVVASSLLAYVWHYLFARTLYDELLRPLGHGDTRALVLVVFVGALAFALGRGTRRRRA